MTAKRAIKSIVPFLLVFAILFSLILPVFVYAENNGFSGVTDIEVEENKSFDLLQGVSALDANGAEMFVTVNSVSSNTGETVPAEQTVITIGPAGTVYQVEYLASSLTDTNDAERYHAYRKVVSITTKDASQESEPPQTGSADNKPLPEQEQSDISELATPQPSSAPTTVTALPTADPEEPIRQNVDQATGPLLNGKATNTALPIIFENGLHYVDDPDYPNERIVLYCMNNKLAWPHSTGEHPHVPNYTEGYLTEKDFNSPQAYQECMQKLRKLLFAGYPYNSERLYKIVENSENYEPTVEEFNHMLIVPPQLQTAFPYLGHYNFTLADLKDKKHFDELGQFVQDVARLLPNKVTSNGLTHADILAMPFYKAANALTYSGFGVSEDVVLTAFASMYSDSYYVTETQAYDATQDAVWKLMHDYGVPNNDISSLEHNKLAKVLWQYCQSGALLDREPTADQISIQGDLEFSYNPEDKKWHSGKLKVVEPPEYNGLYHLDLPAGVTAICEGLTYVYGNEEYELVSAEKPKAGSKFAVHADIDWLVAMKQYSPIQSKEFQHMVGAVIRKTHISKDFSYKAEKEGSLKISKTVIGNPNDPEREFSFTLKLEGEGKDLDGSYGDIEFQNGVAHFTLKNGGSVIVNHLPIGTQYTVTEDSSDSYQVTVSNGEGTITENQQVEVAFENKRLYDLLLSKTVEGEMGDKTQLFTFEIALNDEAGQPLTGTYSYAGSVKAGCEQESKAPADGTLTFNEGKATIQLSHGQQIQLQGIPFGCTYTVTEQEANQDGYRTTYNQNDAATGTIDAPVEVHVVNTKEYVPETGVQDSGSRGMPAGILLAVVGLLLPIGYGYLRRKKGMR